MCALLCYLINFPRLNNAVKLDSSNAASGNATKKLQCWVDRRCKEVSIRIGGLQIQVDFRNAMKPVHGVTPPETNIAPEKRWLEDYVPIGKVAFQGLC